MKHDHVKNGLNLTNSPSSSTVFGSEELKQIHFKDALFVKLVRCLTRVASVNFVCTDFESDDTVTTINCCVQKL